MTLTRIQVEKELISRASKRMIFVGMDGTTVDGHNANLNNPIATALQLMGITPTNITAIVDADLATVDNSLKLFDLAEYRLLLNIQGNFDRVDTKVGERSQSFSQFETALDKAIARKEKQLMTDYGIGLGTLTVGSISLNFQQKGESTS